VLVAPPPLPPVVGTAPVKPVPPPVAAAARGGATASRTDRIIIVALDPGHGGEDPGATGPSGTREKDIVLQVAFRLRDRINAGSVNGNPMRAFSRATQTSSCRSACACRRRAACRPTCS